MLIKNILGDGGLDNEKANQLQEEKIILPLALQKQMMDFFLKTSIPRRKQEKLNLLSENQSDGSNET